MGQKTAEVIYFDYTKSKILLGILTDTLVIAILKLLHR